MSLPTIGILGAGKLGIVLGQLAAKAGYSVYIGTSKSPDEIALTVEVLVPGAIAASSSDVTKHSDIVILALPLGKFKNLSRDELDGKLVIDAMNYWWEVDGPREDFIPLDQSSSQAVAEHLAGSRVVKALNHMGYHDLYDETKPAGTPGRKAIAIAGDNPADVSRVERIVDDFGFDPLYVGKLVRGSKLEAGTKVFGANMTKLELLKLLS